MTNRTPYLALLVMAACASSVTPAVQAPVPRAVEDPAPPADVDMEHHFWDIAEARDAVIQADLAGVSPPLLRIAEAKYGDDLPIDWRDWVGEMQKQAKAGASAKTLAEAAQVVAKLSATCADCHRATHAGPKVADDVPNYRPTTEGLSERMRRHMWAADALWVGLTAVNHQAWSRGARALMALELPHEAATEAAPAASNDGTTEIAEVETEEGETEEGETEETPALSPFAAKLDAIRLLGQRADDAAYQAEKTAVYAEILTHCANCHTDVGNGQVPGNSAGDN